MKRNEGLDDMLYNKGYPLGLISSGSVFGVKCISTCDVMYAFYFLIKERQIISTFVKIRFEFISTLFKSLVKEQIRRSRRARLNGIALLVCVG